MSSGEGASLTLAPPYSHLPHHSVKRTHNQMAHRNQSSPRVNRSPSPLFVRQNSPRRHEDELSPRRRQLQLPPLVPSIRQPTRNQDNPTHERRPGFDYRRPVTTMPRAYALEEIIDLTEDDQETTAPEQDINTAQDVSTTQNTDTVRPQRLPNYTREIIDLSADTSPISARSEEGRVQQSNLRLPPMHMAAGQVDTPTFRREPSSDIVFVEERPSTAEAPRTGHNLPIITDLTEDDDDVVHVRTASRAGRPGSNLPPPIGRGNVRTAAAQLLVRERNRYIPGANRYIPRDMYDDDFDVLEGPPAHSGRQQQQQRMMVMPGFMDYGQTAFILGEDEEVPGPTPEYTAPDALPDGFTGDPTDKEVVCPACGDELAVGDSEQKRQVWIVKKCGHVYCGQCMLNRSRKSKGKARAGAPATQQFSHCLVDDCQSKVSTKSTVQQIFL